MRTLKQVAINMADAFTRFGLWKGGGSGGGSALSEMTDVTFTNLQANDILKYNGSKWVNDDDNLTTKVDKSVNGVVILKNGKNIELIINIDIKLKSNSWNTILTIPQKYAPNTEGEVRTVCWNNTHDNPMQIFVHNDGNITVYSFTDETINIRATISYLQ